MEEKKRVEREAERILSHLGERVKDLELEVSCAQAREDEAKKLVEEYARVHAETRYVLPLSTGKKLIIQSRTSDW
jgi:hypothetical protein